MPNIIYITKLLDENTLWMIANCIIRCSWFTLQWGFLHGVFSYWIWKPKKKVQITMTPFCLDTTIDTLLSCHCLHHTKTDSLILATNNSQLNWIPLKFIILLYELMLSIFIIVVGTWVHLPRGFVFTSQYSLLPYALILHVNLVRWQLHLANAVEHAGWG